jgi:hypothetical protein
LLKKGEEKIEKNDDIKIRKRKKRERREKEDSPPLDLCHN